MDSNDDLKVSTVIKGEAALDDDRSLSSESDFQTENEIDQDELR